MFFTLKNKFWIDSCTYFTVWELWIQIFNTENSYSSFRVNACYLLATVLCVCVCVCVCMLYLNLTIAQGASYYYYVTKRSTWK